MQPLTARKLRNYMQTLHQSQSPKQAQDRPGDPAFPKFAAWQRGGQIECGTYGDGLTQRAYIAARCLQGLLANPDFEPIYSAPETKPEAYARRAVDYADALLSGLAAAAGKDGAL